MAHDLHDYMQQLSAKMEAEYARIRQSASGDPGTAGDEGEENWAQLLRDWLPPTYQVVTKGQLIDEDGNLSPQVDVLVLKPTYPPSLHHKKKYFVSGVAAVLECKLTLKKAHIFDAVKTASLVKRLARQQEGSPYRELTASPLFVLVAHAHSWRDRGGDLAPIDAIAEHLSAADLEYVKHPREMLDLLCASNLATWEASKDPLLDPGLEIDEAERSKLDPSGVPSTSYMCHINRSGILSSKPFPNFSPIGVFISELLVKLAWEDLPLRDIAGYFLGVGFSTTSFGKDRHWVRTIYSPSLRRRISLRKLDGNISWNEWARDI